MSICLLRRKKRRRSIGSSSAAATRSARSAIARRLFRAGDGDLGALADIYGLQVAADHTEVSLADYFSEQLHRRARTGDIVELGPIALLAHKVESGNVTTVGLRLAEPEEPVGLGGRIEALRRWFRDRLN